MMTECFWVVWNVNRGVPRHQHSNIDAAKQEAEQLASLHKGETFIVLKSVCEVSGPKHLVWETHTTDGMPF